MNTFKTQHVTQMTTQEWEILEKVSNPASQAVYYVRDQQEPNRFAYLRFNSRRSKTLGYTLYNLVHKNEQGRFVLHPSDDWFRVTRVPEQAQRL